jgi:DNA-directed RNA polymerase subunit N (RpoN/RPB10)
MPSRCFTCPIGASADWGQFVVLMNGGFRISQIFTETFMINREADRRGYPER